MRVFLICALAVLAGPVNADPAVIRDVTAQMRDDGWHFSVTLSHEDTGWKDYADGWRIVNPDTGEVYGTRELLHPHVDEQPFTRSLSGVAIPRDVSVVIIEESTTQSGWAGINPPLPSSAPIYPRWKPRNSRVFAVRPSSLCSAHRWDSDAEHWLPRDMQSGLLDCEVRANRKIVTPIPYRPFKDTADGRRPVFR